MLIAFGDASCGEQRLGAFLQAAIAAGDTTIGSGGDGSPAGAFAFGADFRGDFHVLTLPLWADLRKWKRLWAGVEGRGKAATDFQKSSYRRDRRETLRRTRRKPISRFGLAGWVGAEGLLGGCVFYHLQKDAGFGAQGAAAGVNYIEAALQGFGVEELHGGEFVEANFASHGELREE